MKGDLAFTADYVLETTSVAEFDASLSVVIALEQGDSLMRPSARLVTFQFNMNTVIRFFFFVIHVTN